MTARPVPKLKVNVPRSPRAGAAGRLGKAFGTRIPYDWMPSLDSSHADNATSALPYLLSGRRRVSPSSLVSRSGLRLSCRSASFTRAAPGQARTRDPGEVPVIGRTTVV